MVEYAKPEVDFSALPGRGTRITTQSVDTDNKLVIKKTQDFEPLLTFVDDAATNITVQRRRDSAVRLTGTIPDLVAVSWAREWGVRLYSREWLEKAHQRVKHDPNWRKLRINYSNRIITPRS